MGDDPEFWGDIGLGAIAVIGGFIAGALAVGVLLIVLAKVV